MINLGKKITIRAETFAARNFRVFRVFWSISRKFMPLGILDYQNAKVFSPKIKDILIEYDFFFVCVCFSTIFALKTKNIFKNAKVFPLNLFLKSKNAKVFFINLVFKARKSSCSQKFLPSQYLPVQYFQ